MADKSTQNDELLNVRKFNGD